MKPDSKYPEASALPLILVAVCALMLAFVTGLILGDRFGREDEKARMSLECV